MKYRVVNDNGWKVQKRINIDTWVTVWFCSSEETAKARLRKCVSQSKEWDGLSPEERRRRILR